MKDLPVEIGYVLIFVVIMLFQYVMKRFAPPEPDAPAQEQFEEFPEELAAASATMTPSAELGPGDLTATPSNAALGPVRRFSRKSLMGNKRETQDAIAIATILGPCRAFEPHDAK